MLLVVYPKLTVPLHPWCDSRDLALRGLGVDIVAVHRLRRMRENHGEALWDYLFAPEERSAAQQQDDPVTYYACAFAVKEAFVKALGTGLRGRMDWRDIALEERDGLSLLLRGASLEQIQGRQVQTVLLRRAVVDGHGLATVSLWG